MDQAHPNCSLLSENSVKHVDFCVTSAMTWGNDPGKPWLKSRVLFFLCENGPDKSTMVSRLRTNSSLRLFMYKTGGLRESL